MADSYEDFLRDDAAYERALNHREELEREDIIGNVFTNWRKAVTPKPPQPVVAILDGIRNDWEAA